MAYIHEPAKKIPIHHNVDVCVLGGSCTGVFAAVRAAQSGLNVVLVEKTNCFGGVAANGLVNVWHSLYDTEFRNRIIGGLTLEVMSGLEKRKAVIRNENNPSSGFIFNSEELKIQLDELVEEHAIIPMLHTCFCAPVMDEETIAAVVLENKDGRVAVQADVFIDATGDGDLAARCGIGYTDGPDLQPPTTCAKIKGFDRSALNYRELFNEHYEEFGLEKDSGWSCRIPGLDDTKMFAETHVFGVNCSKADQLTRAEIEGRRQIRAVMDMIRKYGPDNSDIALAGLASYIGIRETRRFEAEYRLTEEDVLTGRRFEDAIAQGSYRVDVHYPDGGGFLFKYLDGTTRECRGDEVIKGRWRGRVEKDPVFYQIPYRCMVNAGISNLIMAGRMISTDTGAFGAVRVMVNLNQVGEAAGTAAAVAVEQDMPTHGVDPDTLRERLESGGSVII